MRQVGPGTLCCSACTCANIFLSNEIQRIYKGLKTTCVYAQLGQIMDKIQKDQKPSCHF